VLVLRSPLFSTLQPEQSPPGCWSHRERRKSINRWLRRCACRPSPDSKSRHESETFWIGSSKSHYAVLRLLLREGPQHLHLPANTPIEARTSENTLSLVIATSKRTSIVATSEWIVSSLWCTTADTSSFMHNTTPLCWPDATGVALIVRAHQHTLCAANHYSIPVTDRVSSCVKPS